MNESTWLRIAVAIRDLWPASTLPDATISAWYPFVADLDADELAQAVRRLALDPDQRHAPSIAVIRRETTTPIGGGRTWLDAYRDLQTAIDAGGAKRPTFSDRALQEVVDRLGRWGDVTGHISGRPLIDVNSDAFRAQFRDGYRQARASRDAFRRNEVAKGLELRTAAREALPAGGTR